MAILFDTVAFQRLRRREKEAEELSIRFHPAVVCVHTVGEFLYGLEWAQVPAETYERELEFLAEFEVLSPNRETAAIYGHLRSEMRHRGFTVPEPDYWIAAHAIENRMPVVTLDNHFEYFTGLKVYMLR